MVQDLVILHVKKIFLTIFLYVLLIGTSHSEIINIFCIVGKNDLEKAKLDKSDFSRFAGKVIKFQINTDKNLIFDISDDNLTVLTGINEGSVSYERIGKGFNYTNKQEVRGEGQKKINYRYKNTLSLNDYYTDGFLFAKIDQTGISFKKFDFSFRCRSRDYSVEEKRIAKLAGALLPQMNLDEPSSSEKIKNKRNKEKLNLAEYDQKKKDENLIADLENYKFDSIEGLLYKYKIKLFDNDLRNYVWLKRNYHNFKSGQKIFFKDVEQLNEKRFFSLPLHKNKDKLKKLRKDFLKEKKTIKIQG